MIGAFTGLLRSLGGRAHLAPTFLLLSLLPPAWAAVAVADGPGEIIVQPANGVTVDQINAKYGTTTLLKLTDSTQALLLSATVSATSAAMAADAANVAWVEPNATASEPRARTMDSDSGADPYSMSIVLLNGSGQYGSQWGIARATFDLAQQEARGKGVVIAVLDTKIDTSHPALAGRTQSGIDLVSSDPLVNVVTVGRSSGHGTFVAGVALLAAPASKVLPVRVLNEDGFGSVATVAEGIRRTAAGGVGVINMSLGTSTRSQTLEDAVNYARKRGIVMSAAYGNEGQNSPAVYPADSRGVLSVVATDQQDKRASFSNYGRAASVAAPGVGVVGPYVSGQYAVGSGTSFSAAWVSGQAALLISEGGGSSAASQIVSTADNIDAANGGTKLGFGRINAARSLK